jgi:hypothetical protein
MRTFARFTVNLAMLLGTAAVVGWVTTLKAYHAASPHMRMGIVIGITVAFFLVARVVLGKVIPAKKKTGQRTAYPYATAGRGK